MTLHKLLLEDFHDDEFSLIAIHCSLEDFRLAYYINSHLNLRLARRRDDLDFEYTKASYAIYEFIDDHHFTDWHLVANICKREEEALTSSGSLFQQAQKIVRTYSLLPEYQNVNYILKIQSDNGAVNERQIVNQIKEIPHVIAVFAIDCSTLKSKNNLIFN